MIPFTLKLSKTKKLALESVLKRSEKNGDIHKLKRVLSILMIGSKYPSGEIASILKISAQCIRDNVKKYLVEGVHGLRSGKSPGRPAKLTKAQKKELRKIIKDGPETAGFPGCCWRSPMIQELIYKKFGVFYNTRYISELLNNMGFSYQKAKFIASKRDKKARKDWLENVWPKIMKLAKEKNAYILFGDEASFPQWGSLSYTWAPIGKQPVVKTIGSRKNYKVFGLIDYFTGKFFSKGHEGKLNSDSYTGFIKSVLSITRKHIILVQDGAPYHKGKIVDGFFETHKDRLTVFQLPSYSPDYNPIEKLWKKIKEKGIHLQFFPTFEDLKCKVNEMLDIFSDAQKEVLPLFGFYEKLIAA